MKQLIYCSVAEPDLDFNELSKMVKKADVHNHTLDITGFLVYNGIYFLQCIEGEEKNIYKLYDLIHEDKRHKHLKTIGIEDCNERDFPNWHMEYIGRDKITSEVLVELTGHIAFEPEKYDFSTAKKVLKKLSTLV